MFQIKICGITSIEEARVAIDAGADAIGLNFFEQSRRYLHPQKARGIASAVATDVTAVGLFVNNTADEITKICNTVELSVVQLHGDEPPEFLGLLNREYKIIRARRVSENALASIAADLQACSSLSGFCPEAILVDAESAGLYGGTGKKVDWSNLAGHQELLGVSLILAGGLNPENVAEAIRTVRPHGVDVASGVESSPGVKDHEKVRLFVENARAAFDEIAF